MRRHWRVTQPEIPCVDVEFVLYPEDILEGQVEYTWSRTLAKLEALTKQLNDKFLHKEKSLGITDLANQYLILAAQLKIHAEARLVEIAQDKVKYAPHPDNPQF